MPPQFDVDVTEGRSRFPVIDFKLQNTGEAAAIMWQFELVIEAVEIDPTPVLSATLTDSGTRSGSRYIEVSVTNNGWGPALDATFVVEGPVLSKLIAEQHRIARGEIPSGATERIRLDGQNFDPKIFGDLALNVQASKRAEYAARFSMDFQQHFGGLEARAKEAAKQETLRRFHKWRDQEIANGQTADSLRESFLTFPRTSPAPIDVETALNDFKKWTAAVLHNEEGRVPLGQIGVAYKARDMSNKSLSGTLHPEIGSFGGEVFAIEGGFLVERHFMSACAMPADTMYCVLLDPDRGKHVRTYPMSRQVKAGEGERFLLSVGSIKSCRVRLKMRFFVDRDQMIESKLFVLEIWNPIGSGWSGDVVDGEAKDILRRWTGNSGRRYDLGIRQSETGLPQ